MSTIGKVVAVSLGLVILYDVLELAVKQPGVIPGAAGTFSGLVGRLVSPGVPLVPYAPGYGPQAATTAPAASSSPAATATKQGIIQGIINGLEGLIP